MPTKYQINTPKIARITSVSSTNKNARIVFPVEDPDEPPVPTLAGVAVARTVVAVGSGVAEPVGVAVGVEAVAPMVTSTEATNGAGAPFVDARD